MQIGEVAERLGITPSAIRYYERAGLIENVRRVAGRREFAVVDVKRLGFIQLAQQAGFSIKEIHELLFGFSSTTPASTRWTLSATTKRAALQANIERAQQMLKVLDTLLECECPSLEACGDAFLDVSRKQP
jgi:MerR family redox-sensitive transcriptional activator SoxR